MQLRSTFCLALEDIQVPQEVYNGREWGEEGVQIPGNSRYKSEQSHQGDKRKTKQTAQARHEHAIKRKEDEGRHALYIFTKVWGRALGDLRTNTSTLGRAVV